MRLIMLLAISLVLAGSANSRISSESGLICTLTGQKIAACCCQQRDGHLYCPLANTTIESCCCKLVP
jgi:hypothetical protein